MVPLFAHLLMPLVALAALTADPLASFRGTPKCPRDAAYCFGVDVHIVLEGGKPVQDPKWLAGQLSEANRLFAPLGVGFEVNALIPNASTWADVNSRLMRDQLGRRDRAPGVVHVFMVRRLGDVDVAGAEIRGVHWRDRADTQQRWIILSALGSHRVLAHELGHFFGLPHSSHPASIMNKKPRDRPVPEKRGFPPAELTKMKRGLKKMLAERRLVPKAS